MVKYSPVKESHGTLQIGSFALFHMTVLIPKVHVSDQGLFSSGHIMWLFG